jgi:uncharacterized protein YndB with AHSA1/START domain
VLDETESDAPPPEISVVLPVSPDEAFALLTEPDRLRRWKTVSARVDLRAGGAYRWTIIPGHAVRGTYLEVETGRRLVFGWGWEGSPDLGPDASTVTVTFQPTEGGTLVRLVHTGLNLEQAASHLAGWRHFFDRLSAVARVGDAGPDDWAAVPDPMSDLACLEAVYALCLRAMRDAGDRPSDQARMVALVDHLAVSMARLGTAAGIETADPGSALEPEPRLAAIGQPVLEAWAVIDPADVVAYAGNEVRADLVLAWATIELLVHAMEASGHAGAGPAVSAPLATFVRQRAADVHAAQGADGVALDTRLVDVADRDLIRRLDAALGAETTRRTPTTSEAAPHPRGTTNATDNDRST